MIQCNHIEIKSLVLFSHIKKKYFSALSPNEFRCLIPKCNETLDYHYEVLQFGTEIFGQDGEGNPDYCKRFPVKNNFTGQCSTKEDFDLNASEDDMIACTPDQDIIYDKFGMDYTVTTRFNLVCDDEYKVLNEWP